MAYSNVDWHADPYAGDSDRAAWEPYYEGGVPPWYPEGSEDDKGEDDE